MLVWETVSVVMITHLLACISPGPDFAVVVRNAIAYPRSAALMTTLGTAVGVTMHAMYCALGVAVLLMEFPYLFVVLRWLGACYLIYLGVKAFCSKDGMIPLTESHENAVTLGAAFRQGFFVNALNPKAIFFIFSLFIMVAKLKSTAWDMFFVVEMGIVTALWFMFVVYCISHPKVKPLLVKIQKPIGKLLGVFLVFFGISLFFGS